MKKLSMFLALLVTVLMFAFIMTPPPAFAEEITTTTAEEVTTTTETVEETTTTLGLEEEIDLAFETAKNAVIAFVTGLFTTSVVIGLAFKILDKIGKGLKDKVKAAELANSISKDTADKTVALIETTVFALKGEINEIGEKYDEMKAENVALHGDVSALLAELQERELRIAELLEAVLGTSGEADGEE